MSVAPAGAVPDNIETSTETLSKAQRDELRRDPPYCGNGGTNASAAHRAHRQE